MHKKWFVNQPDAHAVKHIEKTCQLSSIAAKILVARGFTTEQQVKQLLVEDKSAMHDPFLLHNMDKFVERIEHALAQGEKIRIFGDYDCDGITSTALLLQTLYDLGANVDYVIPDRFIHGYGPNSELFRLAHEDGVQLIITVDNGISGNGPIQLAKELGMDVIVTDHHEAGEELPPADMIIHPRIPHGQYPFGELAGVGVALKLAHALYGEVPPHLFGLAAIGTVADLVSLTGENRYIVKKGMENLRRSNKVWVHALCEVAGTAQEEINEETIGFYFAPRLNALGRLGSAMPGVEFLMSEQKEQATAFAQLLNDKNKERKDLVKQTTDQAIAMVEADEALQKARVLIVMHEDWNPGVVGIVASRLVEKYYKPTIVLGINEEKGLAKGSARSIEGFHLYNELAKNRDILPHFGGHPMAAGMTLEALNVPELFERLNNQAQQALTEEQLIPKLTIDVPLDISEVTVEAIEQIAQLGPFGMDFAKPVFALEDVKIKAMRKIGASEDHLKLELEDRYGSIDAIGFSKGYLYDELSYGSAFSFVGDLQINEWQNRKKAQFMVQDVKANEWQLFDMRGKKQPKQMFSYIPKNDTLFVVFDEANITQFSESLQAEIVHASALTSTNKRYIAFLDLPNDEVEVINILQQTQPERIYAHFFTPSSAYFNGMPTRQHFSSYYQFLKNRPSFHLRQHLGQLAKYTGLTEDTIKFMTMVFFELGFVKIENGLISVNEHTEKRALETAIIYKERQKRMMLEEKLLYAPYNELKQWLNSQM